MTASTELQPDDWMDHEARSAWLRRSGQPAQRSDPLARLLAVRTDGVRAANDRARRNGRMLKVVRYVQAPEREAAAQFEALELVAQSRHWLVRDETFVDSAGPALLEYRPGLSAARKMLRSGFADGLLAPTYEHISPHFAEYERFLRDMEAHRWFVALALPETGR